MNEFLWFWLKRWIRLRYPSAPYIHSADLQQILAIQQPGDWVILDARTSAEYNVSSLPGAVRLADGGDLLGLAPFKEASLEQPIVIYCSVGLRSAAVVKKLQQRGFNRAVNLEGGLFQWLNRGYHLINGDQPTIQVHPFNRFWGLLLKPRR